MIAPPPVGITTVAKQIGCNWVILIFGLHGVGRWCPRLGE